MPYKYAYNKDEEDTAKAAGVGLSISIKHAMMISNMIRGKKVETAIEMLEKVQEKKLAVPFTKFGGGMGHKSGIGPGRFPIKACTEILNVLRSAQSNAQSKGLSTNDLKIEHIVANKASTPLRYGRKGGVSTKRSHVEIVVKEIKQAKKKTEEKSKVTEKETPKGTKK